MSCIDSVTYTLAKELTKIISPLTGKSPSFVKDSHDFVKKIHNLHLPENFVMVSFDVTQLFTRVPIQELLEIIQHKIENNLDIQCRTTLSTDRSKELLLRCLTTTYFQWKDLFYEQREGAAMGNPFSPVIANLYMEHFEEDRSPVNGISQVTHLAQVCGRHFRYLE